MAANRQDDDGLTHPEDEPPPSVNSIEKRKAQNKNPRGPHKRLYTIPEAAHYLGRTVNALREMIWAGKLPIVRDGKRILLDQSDMDSYIERHKTVYDF
ncbi:MAG: helix-turn-helix domain-containing protein [Syntrophorhabdaceae bacterium]|nr:helix-turn-helix domain-containing protein [Syntrophorhabdaceae bacterium]